MFLNFSSVASWAFWFLGILDCYEVWQLRFGLTASQCADQHFLVTRHLISLMSQCLFIRSCNLFTRTAYFQISSRDFIVWSLDQCLSWKLEYRLSVKFLDYFSRITLICPQKYSLITLLSKNIITHCMIKHLYFIPNFVML